DPALIAALKSPVFYIGALGSRRTHAKRVERLTEAGLADKVGRIHAPVGLDLGGRAPREIAGSILAQVGQGRHRGERAGPVGPGGARARSITRRSRRSPPPRTVTARWRRRTAGRSPTIRCAATAWRWR